MDKEMRGELRELVKDIIVAEHARTEGKFELIDNKLDNIYGQVKKTNGRVNTLEDKVEVIEKNEIKHYVNCPQASKIRTLEDNQLQEKSIKKWVLKMIVIGTSVVSTIIVFLNFLISSAS